MVELWICNMSPLIQVPLSETLLVCNKGEREVAEQYGGSLKVLLQSGTYNSTHISLARTHFMANLDSSGVGYINL